MELRTYKVTDYDMAMRKKEAVDYIRRIDALKAYDKDERKFQENLQSLPTIEVEGGDLEDAILLTKDAYSDLCLRASQVSDKAECDNCIWNVCNYIKIDWEVSEDCISREYLEEQYWQTLIPKEVINTDIELGINIGITKMYENLKNAPKQKKGEWIDRDGWKFCSECDNRADKQANGVAIEPLCTNYCCECGAKMKGADDE